MHFQHAGPGPIGLWDQTGHHQGRALPVLNGEEQGLILLGRIVIIPAIQVTGDQVIPNLGLYIPAEQQIPGIRALRRQRLRGQVVRGLKGIQADGLLCAVSVQIHGEAAMLHEERGLRLLVFGGGGGPSAGAAGQQGQEQKEGEEPARRPNGDASHLLRSTARCSPARRSDPPGCPHCRG